MSYVSLNELSYLKTFIEALRDAGWFDFSYVGLSNQMKGKRIIAVRPVECDDNVVEGQPLWEGRFEFLIGVSQPIGKADAYIGTQSEPGLVYLTEVVQESLATNLDALCYKYEIGRVVYEQFSLHPEFVARFTLDITKGINTHDRARDGNVGVTVPALQAQNLDDLGDVTITSVSDGQVLKYDSGTGKWINAADDAGTTIDALGDIGDVTDSSSTQGEFLVKGASNWENNADVKLSSSPAGVFLNVPIGLYADPVGADEGDVWLYYNGGTLELRIKTSGGTKKLVFASA